MHRNRRHPRPGNGRENDRHSTVVMFLRSQSSGENASIDSWSLVTRPTIVPPDQSRIPLQASISS
jgi:hypothetical protein